MTIDWHGVFVPALGIAEIVLRGSISFTQPSPVLRKMLNAPVSLAHAVDQLLDVVVRVARARGRLARAHALCLSHFAAMPLTWRNEHGTTDTRIRRFSEPVDIWS